VKIDGRGENHNLDLCGRSDLKYNPLIKIGPKQYRGDLKQDAAGCPAGDKGK